jgi:hypothetical protein
LQIGAFVKSMSDEFMPKKCSRKWEYLWVGNRGSTLGINAKRNCCGNGVWGKGAVVMMGQEGVGQDA